jgi:myosin-1
MGNQQERAVLTDICLFRLVVNFLAYLLDVDADALYKALTVRVMETQRGGRRGKKAHIILNARDTYCWLWLCF